MRLNEVVCGIGTRQLNEWSTIMKTTRSRYYTGPISDNFDGVRFFSPGQPLPDKSLANLLRWRREGGRAKWPDFVPVTPHVPPPRSEQARVTMVGHATLLVQVAGVNLLTDPVWSERVSPLSFIGPKRVTEPGIAFDKLPDIDAVLLSHNHYDHLDLTTLRRLHAAHSPLMVMPYGNDKIVRKSVPDAKIKVGDWHDIVQIRPEISVTLTPANHWSARGIRDRRMALWSGFWINSPKAQIWYAGDTGYGDGALFRDIRVRYGRPDIAIIPIGAYEPRWFMSDQHVAPDESVRIFEDTGARQALGMHWGTFQLTNEARNEPRELLRDSLVLAGIDVKRFLALEPGEFFSDSAVR